MNVVSEELVYVQRQIEHQVDQLRASEKEKLKQSSRLQDAEANRKELDLQLSQVTKAQSTLAELFESEKLASNSTISNLRQGLADRDEQILMSTSQMQMARREIAEHVQDNSRLMVSTRSLYLLIMLCFLEYFMTSSILSLTCDVCIINSFCEFPISFMITGSI